MTADPSGTVSFGDAHGVTSGFGGRTGTGNGDSLQPPGRGSGPSSSLVSRGGGSMAIVRSGSSPRRVNTLASLGGSGGGGTGPSPRKGVSIGGTVNVGGPQAAPGPLPGGAASALGYAS